MSAWRVASSWFVTNPDPVRFGDPTKLWPGRLKAFAYLVSYSNINSFVWLGFLVCLISKDPFFNFFLKIKYASLSSGLSRISFLSTSSDNFLR